MAACAARIILLAAALVIVAATGWAGDPKPADEWLRYRDRFVGADGRVHDTGNKDISHSEGQGSAMLFAETFNDRASFERIWNWTRTMLARPDSALFAWRWDPNADKPVADTNNATDGDILVAWALARAAQRWKVRDYAKAARSIVAEIREKLITRVAGRLVLLPGSDGFAAKDGAIVVNPSYYIYPALEAFPRLDGSPQWARLRRDGLDLLARARFGEWNLPADWIAIDKTGHVTPAAQLPPRFGFDAIRIPLYLVWGREATAQRLAAMAKFWNGFADKPMPAWVDVTDGSLAPFPAPSGFAAIVGLVRARLHDRPAPPPQIDDTDDYYSASLILLAGLARQAIGR